MPLPDQDAAPPRTRSRRVVPLAIAAAAALGAVALLLSRR
jgi:hypothetical protein